MKKLVLLLVVVSLFIASPVLAANGKKLLNDCNNVIKYQQNKSDKTVSVLGAGLCYGYIGSTIDTHASLTEFFNRDKLFCSPADLKSGDAARIVVNYLKKYPQKSNELAYDLVLEALIEAFPCLQSKLNFKPLF